MTEEDFGLSAVKTVSNSKPRVIAEEPQFVKMWCDTATLKVVFVQNWIAGIQQFNYSVSPRYFFGYGLTVAAK